MGQDVPTNWLLGISLKPEMGEKLKDISAVFHTAFVSENLLFVSMRESALSYVIPAPGSAVIWLVINTATLYSDENIDQSQ